MAVSLSRQCGAAVGSDKVISHFGRARTERILYCIYHVASLREVLPRPAIYDSDMSSSTQQDDDGANDLHALAFSTSQMRARILGCHQLFSKRKESHLLEVTRFARDAPHAPSTHSFTCSSQLLAYFGDGANDPGGQSSDLEI